MKICGQISSSACVRTFATFAAKKFSCYPHFRIKNHQVQPWIRTKVTEGLQCTIDTRPHCTRADLLEHTKRKAEVKYIIYMLERNIIAYTCELYTATTFQGWRARVPPLAVSGRILSRGTPY